MVAPALMVKWAAGLHQVELNAVGQVATELGQGRPEGNFKRGAQVLVAQQVTQEKMPAARLH